MRLLPVVGLLVSAVMARLSDATWQEIRTKREAGYAATYLAGVYGVTRQAIDNKANSHGWDLTGKTASAINDSTEGENGGGETDECKYSLTFPSCDDPEAFQSAVGSWAERLLAAGAPAIEPPRNIAEAKILNDIIRKARGMDLKAAAAPASLVSAPRTLSRRPAAVIDVLPIENESQEEDPFEP